MSRKVILSIIICLALVAGGMLIGTDEVTGAAKQTVTAAKVSKAPTSLDDPAWQKAKSVKVPFEGKEKFAGKKATVNTQAIYTDDGIYFRFNWNDATKSVIKGAWEYDDVYFPEKTYLSGQLTAGMLNDNLYFDF